MRAGTCAAAVMFAVVALTGAPAHAQAGRGPLFMSPMGEPFRGDGVTAPIRVWFSAADHNGDGQLSRDEFAAQAMSFFHTTLDANGDGAVTSIESSALWRAQAPELAAARPSPTAQPRPPRQRSSGTPNPRERRNAPRPEAASEPMAHFALFDIAEPVMSCDVDLSRRVTPEEFEACAARRFALLDADGDGVFTLEENPRALALAGGS